MESLFSDLGQDEFVEKVVDEIGYTEKRYFRNGEFNSIKMAKDVIEEYGSGHELAGYDGETNEVEYNGKTYYIFRQQ